jgi:hypothetical protein
MKTFALLSTLLLGSLSARAAEQPPSPIVELPRPNSGTFTFAEAEARKLEILSNAPTQKLENWKSPTMGFCIHIGKDDSLTVYNHFMKDILKEAADGRQTVAGVKTLSTLLPLGGNPAGILITSDLPLKESKVIHEVLKVLFVPSVQLFYARN